MEGLDRISRQPSIFFYSMIFSFPTISCHLLTIAYTLAILSMSSKSIGRSQSLGQICELLVGFGAAITTALLFSAQSYRAVFLAKYTKGEQYAALLMFNDWTMQFMPLTVVSLPFIAFVSVDRLKIGFVYGIIVCQLMLCSHLLFHNVQFESISCGSWTKRLFLVINGTAYFLMWFSSQITPGYAISIIAIISHAIIFLATIKEIRVITKRAKRVHVNEQVSDVKSDGIWKLVLCLALISWNWITYFCATEHESAFEIEQLSYSLLMVVAAISLFHPRVASVDQDSASKLADEMNLAFVRFISHELLSHVNHLTMGLQMMNDENHDDKKRRKIIADLRETCGDSHQVLSDLAVLTELQSGSSKEVKEFVSCASALKAGLKGVTHEAAGKKCTLVKDVVLSQNGTIDISDLGMHLDPAEFAYCLRTLLRLAVKASDAGGSVVLRVRLLLEDIDTGGVNGQIPRPQQHQEQQEEDLRGAVEASESGGAALVRAGRLQIEVVDNGSGFSEEDQAKIFHPTVNSVSVHALLGGQGSGLGLSIVHKMVTRANASIKLYSAGRAQGSTFTVVYPVYRRQQEGVSQAPTSSRGPFYKLSAALYGSIFSSNLQLSEMVKDIETGEGGARASSVAGARAGSGSGSGKIISEEERQQLVQLESDMWDEMLGDNGSSERIRLMAASTAARVCPSNDLSSSGNSKNSKNSSLGPLLGHSGNESPATESVLLAPAPVFGPSRNRSILRTSYASSSAVTDWSASAYPPGSTRWQNISILRASYDSSRALTDRITSAYHAADRAAVAYSDTQSDGGDIAATHRLGLEWEHGERDDAFKRILADVFQGTLFTNPALFLRDTILENVIDMFNPDRACPNPALTLQVFQSGRAERVEEIIEAEANAANDPSVGWNMQETEEDRQTKVSILVSIRDGDGVVIAVLRADCVDQLEPVGTIKSSTERATRQPLGHAAKLSVVRSIEPTSAQDTTGATQLASRQAIEQDPERAIAQDAELAPAVQSGSRTAKSTKTVETKGNAIVANVETAAAAAAAAAAVAAAETMPRSQLLVVGAKDEQALQLLGNQLSLLLQAAVPPRFRPPPPRQESDLTVTMAERGERAKVFSFSKKDDGISKQQEAVESLATTSKSKVEDNREAGGAVGAAEGQSSHSKGSGGSNESGPGAAATTAPLIRCLVTDDSTSARKHIRQMLERCFGGVVSVVEADDGAEAVRCVGIASSKHASFDAVFLDCLMPIMDGPTAAGAIMGMGYQGKIIGISGMITLASNAFGMANVPDVFEKPLSQIDVTNIVAVLLRLKASPAPPLVPAASSKPRAAKERRESQRSFSAHSSDESSVRFLVVDDVSSNRRIVAQLITKFGHSASMAVDGVDAVNVYRKAVEDENPFDCILMDFVMPHMDGPAAAKAIRALGFTGLIFGLTGNVLRSDVEHFIAHGADRVLGKPLKKETLKGLIQDIKKRRQLNYEKLSA